MFQKEQTWKFSEYAQTLREKAALKEIEQTGVDEFLANRILANIELKKIFIFSLAGLMSTQKALAAPKSTESTKVALNKVDVAGGTILAVVRSIGYWICIIMCVVEILRCLGQGDTKQIGKIILKYLIAFGACYLLPWLFDLIRDIFS
jgi:hypothetical protein